MQVVGEQIALAQTAAASKDWGRALEHWRIVAEQAPLLSVGWTGVGQALIELGRLDEAEAVLGPIADRFREDRVATILYAAIAAVRRDWAEMLRRSQVVARRFADDPTGYINIGIALRELGRLDESDAALATAIAGFPDNRWALIHRATNAMRRRDWQGALAHWQAITARWPEEPEPYIEAGAALSELRRWDEAEAVLAAAAGRFPDSRPALLQQARLATARGDREAALRRWRRFCERFPDDPEDLIAAATAVAGMQCLDEAEALLREAMERFPQNIYLAANFARIATFRRDWDEAVSRWRAMRSRFPDHPVSWAGEGEALRESGRYDQAEEAFAQAVELSAAFRDSEWGVVGYAEIAALQRHWGDAVRRWEEVRSRFPGLGEGWTGCAEALVQLGRLDEAEAVLAAGTARCPRNETVAAQYARLAIQSGDWDEAVRRWGLVRFKFPGSLLAYLGSAEALTKAQRPEEARAVLETAIELFPDERSLPRALVMVDRGWVQSGQWRTASRHRRRAEFSAYLSIFDDWDILLPALRSIAPLVDELVVVDGAYRWMAPYLEAIGRNPARSDDRVYQAIEQSGIPFRVISGAWNNESQKRAAGFDACRARYVFRVDADEIFFIDHEMLEFFMKEGAAAAEMEAPTLVAPGWLMAPRQGLLPRAGFVFDSRQVGGAEHLNYLWLVASDRPEKALQQSKLFPEPVAFNAHLTNWRTPATGIGRAAFYSLNHVRTKGAPWFADLRTGPMPDPAALFERIPPLVFRDVMRGSQVAAGHVSLGDCTVKAPPPATAGEPIFSLLFDNALRAHAEANAALAQTGRQMIERSYLDLSTPEAVRPLSAGSGVSLRFSSKIRRAKLALHHLVPTEPWEITVKLDAVLDGDRLAFAIPDEVPGFLRRILQLDVVCESAYPVAKFTVER